MNEQTTPRMSGGLTEIHVQRHDDHVQGHITPEGHEHAREIALGKVAAYLDADPSTNFMVVASDQVFDDREPEFGGIRAHETAEEVTAAVRKTLADRGLPADQLFASNTDPVTVNATLREAGIFSNNFMRHLREQYPGENSWNLYYQDTDAEKRKEVGAESPHELARRMDYVVKSAELAGATFHAQPGKEDTPLLVWMVGHGGGLDSYLHHYADVPLEELGFDFSGGFSLHASPDHGVVADVKGKEYPVRPDTTMGLPG